MYMECKLFNNYTDLYFNSENIQVYNEECL